jgi:hypothetical protein
MERKSVIPRKIQLREFALIFYRKFITSAGCVFFRFESMKTNFSAVCGYFSGPASFIGRDSSVSTSVVAAPLSVDCILRFSGWPQVLASIVEPVLIPMVCVFSENKTMHADYFAVDSGDRVEGGMGAMSTPVVPIDPLEISSVNNRNFPLRQRDVSERFVLRLSYFVSSYTQFHRSTLNGLNLAAF